MTKDEVVEEFDPDERAGLPKPSRDPFVVDRRGCVSAGVVVRDHQRGGVLHQRSTENVSRDDEGVVDTAQGYELGPDHAVLGIEIRGCAAFTIEPFEECYELRGRALRVDDRPTLLRRSGPVLPGQADAALAGLTGRGQV